MKLALICARFDDFKRLHEFASLVVASGMKDYFQLGLADVIVIIHCNAYYN